MKDLLIFLDPGGLHHHDQSGRLVLYLEASDISRLSQRSDLSDGLQITVCSDSADSGDFRGVGMLALDQSLNQWRIEFRDQDICFKTEPTPEKQVSDIVSAFGLNTPHKSA